MKSFMRKVRRSAKSLGRGQKGFTLIEVLVVVAILGVLAAVAVPQVAKFIGEGTDQSYEVELRDVQTAVTAMMTEAASGQVDVPITDGTGTADLSTVTSVSKDDATVTLHVSDYMVGLEGTTVKTGCTYEISADGIVTQHTP